MGFATQNCLRCSALGEWRGWLDRLYGNNSPVFRPNGAFDHHNAVFYLSAIGHNDLNYSMLWQFYFGAGGRRKSIKMDFFRKNLARLGIYLVLWL